MKIITWRIVRKKYAAIAFNGAGARRFGGRWNRPGVPMVYTSGSLALAILEILVNLESPADFNDFIYIPVKFDAALSQALAPKALPSNWNSDPIPPSTMDLGSDWIKSGRSAILEVPSVLSPEEKNYLLNPLHPDFKKLEIGKPKKLAWDPRLAKGKSNA